MYIALQSIQLDQDKLSYHVLFALADVRYRQDPVWRSVRRCWQSPQRNKRFHDNIGAGNKVQSPTNESEQVYQVATPFAHIAVQEVVPAQLDRTRYMA